MYVNWIQLATYDFGVSSAEAVHSVTRQLCGPKRIV
jgi:hypothetical protein